MFVSEECFDSWSAQRHSGEQRHGSRKRSSATLETIEHKASPSRPRATSAARPHLGRTATRVTGALARILPEPLEGDQPVRMMWPAFYPLAGNGGPGLTVKKLNALTLIS